MRQITKQHFNNQRFLKIAPHTLGRPSRSIALIVENLNKSLENQVYVNNGLQLTKYLRHFSEPKKEPEQEPISEPTGSEQVNRFSSVEGAATSETDLEDRPFEGKTCKRRFKTAPPRRNSKERIKECDK